MCRGGSAEIRSGILLPLHVLFHRMYECCYLYLSTSMAKLGAAIRRYGHAYEVGCFLLAPCGVQETDEHGGEPLGPTDLHSFSSAIETLNCIVLYRVLYGVIGGAPKSGISSLGPLSCLSSKSTLYPARNSLCFPTASWRFLQ